MGMHPTEGFHQPAVGDCAEHRDQYKEIRSSGIPEEMVVVCYTRRGLVVCVCVEASNQMSVIRMQKGVRGVKEGANVSAARNTPE